MAPAVLANLIEPSFQGHCGAVFMRKYTNQALADEINNPLFNPNPNPNPNLTSAYGSNSCKQFDDSLPYGDYVSFELDGYTSSQLRELKKRLNLELEQVRFLKERIESGKFVSGSVYTTQARSFADETNDVGVKKTKKKKIGHGQKRSSPFPTNEPGLKRHVALDLMSEKVLTSMMSTCSQILVKLMKQKWSWVFNKPVDVLGLGLHDYHLIVKKPMDLGTVKQNLEKGFYRSPIDFASDVRLTFTNAMAYNPKGQDVYLMAEKLLGQFDTWFSPTLKRFDAQELKVMGSSSRPKPELYQGVWNQSQVADNVRKGPEQISIAKKLDSVKTPPTLPSPVIELPRVPSPPPSPVHLPPPAAAAPEPVSQVEARLEVGETNKARKGKLPKPKAKDPNKRLMAMEEKAKLGVNLQELPPEKLGQLIQILRKRTKDLPQDGDEIELDIEALDNETLWELDRFVTNYKKMASKIKRQGFIQNMSTPPRNLPLVTEVGSTEKRSRKGGDAGEEDVDIGEDIPIEDYPSVEIERDGTAAAAASGRSSSSGSSSSSASSSSSDSDSGSSSGSDSDADTVQSPFVEAKEAPL